MTSSSLVYAESADLLAPHEEALEISEEEFAGASAPARTASSTWCQLRWAGPAAMILGLLAVHARGSPHGEAAAVGQVVGLQEAQAFTCEAYGCLDVASPTNPCGCSQKCVDDGNCCADYQASCAAYTPATNPHLQPWAGCSGTPPAPPLTALWHYAPSGTPLTVRVMSYNAEWWHVIEQMGGNGNSAAKNIMDAAVTQPIDIIGMQEFYDPWWGFTRPGVDASSLLNDYQWLRGEVGGPIGSIIGYRKSDWALVSRGQKFVAEDKDGEMNFGKRIVFWVRLYHLTTGKTVLFANHHGPLPTDSGGKCGGPATAANILNGIAEGAEDGDAIVLTGDFNAAVGSQTYQTLSGYLQKNFGGIDNIWTNLPPTSISAPIQVGTGGSDHSAITVVLNL